jgi:hypothetical protein
VQQQNQQQSNNEHSEHSGSNNTTGTSNNAKTGCIFTIGIGSTPNILAAWSDYTTSDSAAQVRKRHASSLKNSLHIRESVSHGKFHETMAGGTRKPATLQKHAKRRPNFNNQVPEQHPVWEDYERQKNLEMRHTHNPVVSMTTLRALGTQNRTADATLSRSLLLDQKRRLRKEMVLLYREKELEHEYEDVSLDCRTPSADSLWGSQMLPVNSLVEQGMNAACSGSPDFYRKGLPPGIGQTTRTAYKLR